MLDQSDSEREDLRHNVRHHHSRKPIALIPASLYKRLSYFPYLFTLFILSSVFLIALIVSLFHSYNLKSAWNDACKPLSMYVPTIESSIRKDELMQMRQQLISIMNKDMSSRGRIRTGIRRNKGSDKASSMDTNKHSYIVADLQLHMPPGMDIGMHYAKLSRMQLGQVEFHPSEDETRFHKNQGKKFFKSSRRRSTQDNRSKTNNYSTVNNRHSSYLSENSSFHLKLQSNSRSKSDYELDTAHGDNISPNQDVFTEKTFLQESFKRDVLEKDELVQNARILQSAHNHIMQENFTLDPQKIQVKHDQFNVKIEKYDIRLFLDFKQLGEGTADSPAFAIGYDMIIIFSIGEDFSTTCLRLHAEGIPFQMSNTLWREYPKNDNPSFTFKPFFDSEGEEKWKSKFRQATLSYVDDVNISVEERSQKDWQKDSNQDTSSSIEKNSGIIVHFHEKLNQGKYQIYLKVLNMRLDNWILREKLLPIDETGPFTLLNQFFPAYARRFIPSLDEPIFRSIFQIELWMLETEIISHGFDLNNLTYISNMQIESKQRLSMNSNSTHYQVVRFYPTPLLSTYMSGWIIGQFDHLEDASNDTVIRVYTPRNLQHFGNIALESAKNATSILSSILQLSFPHNKLDIVSLPDFESILHGIFGIIQVQRDQILIDPSSASMEAKMNLVRTIVQGVADQWTSNLVTSKSWSSISILQGLTQLLSNLAIDTIYPDWNAHNRRNGLYVQDYMAVDSLIHSKSLLESMTVSDILWSVQSLSIKSELLLHSMLNQVGKPQFLSWISQFLSSNQFKAIDTIDLLNALPEKLKENYYEWFANPGYPLVDIHETSIKDKEELVLQQSRFASITVSQEPWWIPLKVIYSNGKTIDISLTKLNSTLPVYLSDWYFIRTELPCRINYPSSNWKKLIQMIHGKHPWITDLDQFHLVSDVFSLAKYRNLSFSFLVDITKAIASRGEESIIAWQGLIHELMSLSRMVYQLPIQPYFSRFCKIILSKVLQNVEWIQPHDTSWNQLRPHILEAGSYFGDENVIQNGLKLFEEYIANTSMSFDPLVLKALLRNAVRNGGEEEYFQVLDLCLSSNILSTRIAASALTQTKSPSLLRTTLDLIMSSHIPTVCGSGLLRDLIMNPHGIESTWDYFREFQHEIITKFGLEEVNSMIHFFAENFSTSLHHNELDELKGIPTHHINAGKETVYQNQAFLKRYPELLYEIKKQLI